MELKEKPLRGFANEDVCGSRVDPGVADVLAIHPTNSLRSSARTPSQGPEGLPDAENKLLRSFANGDVCGSWVEGLSRLKDKPLRALADGDVCHSNILGAAGVPTCEDQMGFVFSFL